MNELKEVWKPIKGYEGLYEISNLGRVKSLEKEWVIPGKGRMVFKEHFLKLSLTRDKYYHVSLCKNNHKKSKHVHLLVWDAFGEDKRNGRVLVVDHIDENKLNNKIDNLQLLTTRGNVSKNCKNRETSSKYTGVSWWKKTRKWRASIIFKGKSIFLGYFFDELEASMAYQKALSDILSQQDVKKKDLT